MSEGRHNWPIAVRRWVASRFVERQIIIRANGRVRYLSVSARAQAVTAGSLFLIGAWAAYATLGIVHQARVVAAKEVAIAEARDAYARLIDKVDSYQGTLGSLQKELEVRQEHLSRLFDEKRSLEGELAEMQRSLDQTEAVKGRLEAGRLALHRQLDSLTGNLATAESVNRILAEKLGQTRTRLTVVQNERARTAEERVELDRKLWRADDELRDALSRANLLNAELEAITSDLRTVQGERRDLQESNQALRRQVSDLEVKLGQRYADIRAEMERRLKSLERNNARDRLSLVQEHRREVAALEGRQAQMAKDHASELARIEQQRAVERAEHSQEVAGLTEEVATADARLDAERDDMRARFDTKLAEIAAAQAAKEAKGVAAIDELRQAQGQELARRDAERADMHARFDAKLAEIAAAQEAKDSLHVAEIDELRQAQRQELARRDDERDDMRAGFDAKLAEMAAAEKVTDSLHVAEIDELRQNQHQELARRDAERAAAEHAWDERRRQIEAHHEAALAELRGQRDEAVAALDSARREGERRDREAAAQLAGLREAWRQRLISLDAEQAMAERKMEAAYLARLDIVADRQDREIAALVDRQRQERTQAERLWLAERAGLVSESDARLDALKRRHRIEMAEQQKSHEQELAVRAKSQADALAAQQEERALALAEMQREHAAEVASLSEQLAEERRAAEATQSSLQHNLTRRIEEIAAEKEATIEALRRTIDTFDGREVAMAIRHEQDLKSLEADLDRERVEALAKSERLWTERIEMAERTSSREIGRLKRTLAALEGSTDETVAELSRQVDELESMRRNEVEAVRRKMEERLADADAFRREEIAALRETMRKRLSTIERDMRTRIAHVVAQKQEMERAHRGLLTNLIEQTRENAREVESVIAKTGLDPDQFVPEEAQEEAVGGPFVAIDASQLADIPIEQVANAVAANLARWRVLQQVVRQLPLSAPLETYRITSLYGKRRDPFNGRWAYHPGVDFKAPRRTPVFVTSPGTVVHAGWKGNYGRTVEVDHGHGLVSRYAHLHSVDVSIGQKVGDRDRIGTLGSTGRSTGPHLHYEILLNGERYDPLKFLKAGKDVFKG